jgi:hypothetical protein
LAIELASLAGIFRPSLDSWLIELGTWKVAVSAALAGMCTITLGRRLIRNSDASPLATRLLTALVLLGTLAAAGTIYVTRVPSTIHAALLPDATGEACRISYRAESNGQRIPSRLEMIARYDTTRRHVVVCANADWQVVMYVVPVDSNENAAAFPAVLYGTAWFAELGSGTTGLVTETEWLLRDSSGVQVEAERVVDSIIPT